MSVSISGVGRFLFWLEVPEPEARGILRNVRKLLADGDSMWGGQMIDYLSVIPEMGVYGVKYDRWICSDDSLEDRCNMVEDWQRGTCVVLASTLIVFLRQYNVRTKLVARIMRRAQGSYSDGVITVAAWGEFIPESLMPAWFEFNELPPEEPDFEAATYNAEVAVWQMNNPV